MLKKHTALTYSFFISILFFHSANASTGTNQSEQDKAREMNLAPQQQNSASSRDLPVKQQIRFPEETPCRIIHKIEIESDEDKLTQKLLGKLINQANNKCLGINGIRLLSQTLQNELIVQGYITSLIDIPVQSLEDGILRLTLTWGKVGKIAFSSDSVSPTSLWNSLPLTKGKILKLADLEQGMANLERTLGSLAKMRLLPGYELGESDILLSRSQNKKWQIGAWLDDAGSRASGRYQGGGALYFYDLTGLNDVAYISMGGDVEFNERNDGNKNRSLYYSIPFGYWMLSLYGSYSEYLQLFKGRFTTTDYQSHNRYYNATISRLLSHTRQQKTTIEAKIAKSTSHYFFGGSEVRVMRKQNPVWGVTLRHQHYFERKTLSASLGVQRSLPWLSSMATPEQKAGLYSKLSRVINADIQGMMKFKLTGDKFTWAPRLSAQFSPDKLSSDNKFNLGNRWSVRGFDGESNLSSNQGWYLRNDFIWDLPLSGQQFFVGLDVGKAIGKNDYYSGKWLSGATIGLRGEKYLTQYELFAGTPISKPNNFKTDTLNLGFSLQWRY